MVIKMNDKIDVTFLVNFSEGYIFRNLIDYLKNTNQTGVFIFSREKIVYRQIESGKIINKIEIKCKNLAEYKYNTTDDKILVGINLSDLITILRNIGKRDSIKIFQRTKETSVLYIQCVNNINSDSAAENYSVVRLYHSNVSDTFTEPEYNSSEPTVIIHGSKFIKICKNFSSLKCDSISIIGKNKGLVIVSISKGKILGRIEKIGEFEEQIDLEKFENNPEFCVIRVNSLLMKNLSKLGNLYHSQGIVKIFLEYNKPMKIMTNIGSFGKISVFILS
jgi:hypothetical protein